MDSDLKHFLNNQSSLFRVNPGLPSEDKLRVEELLKNYDIKKTSAHLYLQTSGTTAKPDELKFVVHKLDSLTHAAKSVNKEFGIVKEDVFYQSLPDYHIAGIMTYVRAHVAQAQLIHSSQYKWCAINFYKEIVSSKATVCSLVPTQVYDIVQRGFKAPENFKLSFIGGGFLNEAQFQQLFSLGWKPVLTIGMTETAAMYAYKKAYDECYKAFPHIRWRLNAQSEIQIRSDSLFTSYIYMNALNNLKLINPKINNWFNTEDKGILENDTKVSGQTVSKFKFLGRTQNLVKINGESVYIHEVQQKLQELVSFEVFVVPIESPRSGYELRAVSEHKITENIVSQFNATVLPYERITDHHIVEHIPRTGLGKVKMQDLIEIVTKK